MDINFKKLLCSIMFDQLCIVKLCAHNCVVKLVTHSLLEKKSCQLGYFLICRKVSRLNLGCIQVYYMYGFI